MASAPPKKKNNGSDKQNIKVVVRVRPLNRAETEINVKSIVKCVSQREIMTKDKKFQFDRVFKPEAEQIDVYRGVVAPMVPDILAGYNCTVFAYGPTGSGKTYTMTGDSCECVEDWQTDPYAGCIPRAAAHIFDEIRAIGRTETNVKVSYLELYNEEVRDLLSNDEILLPIFNDNKGCIFIQGLTEISVHDSDGLCKQLLKGVMKRQTAPTLMNHQSSRSHTVFTITVHTRETTVTGEDILKTGKINMVDLAGSENIARSGCKDMRAVELANINKSLLTLGRVIQALADKAPKHVPYRDSKLTRILQDSLGGHTKTAIIATISPAANSYDETVSTLDYASRARDIKNTPTLNEKLTKAQMIQGLLSEIDRLQKDLDAARDGSGFYVDKANYQQLIDTVEIVTGQKITMEEVTRKQSARIKDLEELVRTTTRQFDDTIRECKRDKEKLDVCKEYIKEKKEVLKQERYVAKAYEAQADQLHKDVKELITTTEILSEEKGLLQDKLERQFNINVKNESTARTAVSRVLEMLQKLSEEEEKLKISDENVSKLCKQDIADLKIAIEEVLAELKNVINDFAKSNKEQSNVKQDLKATLDKFVSLVECKSSRLRRIMDDHEFLLRKFERVDMPQFLDKYQQAVQNFIKGVYNIAANLDRMLDGMDYTVMKDFDILLENIQARREDEDLLRQRIREREDEAVACLTRMKNRMAEKRRNRAVELLDKMMIEEKHLNDNVEKLVEELKAQSVERQETVPESKDAEEFHAMAVAMRQELLQDFTSVEEERTVRSTKSLQKLGETIEENYENIGAVLQTKVNIVSSRLDFLLDDRETFEKTYNEFAEKTNKILTDEFLQKVVPVSHEGDTPLRKQLVIPRPIDPQPREALIEKFKQEKDTISDEDKENFPFDLNLSTSSRISESECDLGESKGSRTDSSIN